jgi:hypothetical protein
VLVIHPQRKRLLGDETEVVKGHPALCACAAAAQKF